jgi:hypothetical protein
MNEAVECPYCGESTHKLHTHVRFCKEREKFDALSWFLLGFAEHEAGIPIKAIAERFDEIWDKFEVGIGNED